jgi:hypothetical protein
MPRQDHANTMFRSVISNFIFAGRDSFLKSKKILFAASTLATLSDLPNVFAVFTGLDSSNACISQIESRFLKWALLTELKVLKTLIIVPTLLIF